MLRSFSWLLLLMVSLEVYLIVMHALNESEANPVIRIVIIALPPPIPPLHLAAYHVPLECIAG